MARSHAAVAAAVLAMGALGASARAQSQVYYEDFENEASWPEWSTSQTTEAYPTFTRFLGRFINQRATLSVSLPALPQGDIGIPPPEGVSWVYMLDFRFYCIDSWDGSDTNHGPDRFSVLVNNGAIFSETFSNQHELQSFRGPDMGPMHLGFDQRWLDSVYDISVPFIAPAGMTQVAFEANGLHDVLADESWGIDNVRLRIVQVPTPGAAVLGAAGFGLLGARPRRATAKAAR